MPSVSSPIADTRRCKRSHYENRSKLYDAQSDPWQQRDLAADEPDTVERMFEEYVLKDAGGSLPA